ncbi:enolase 4 [Protopterus annectens]|uniref:enolase 4 n=1 Tax=Protopterus annectens TaxID=7888 RepID=UPI001CFAE6E5|nr:enolase 4 [Protopterus annectens]
MSYSEILANGRISKEARDFYELKNKAAEFYRTNGVPQRIEEVLNAMFYEMPEDVYGYLANYFSEYSKPSLISKIRGKEMLDGKGQPVVQVEILCTVKNHEKSISFAGVPCPSELTENALPDVRQSKAKERRESVNIALEWINEILCPMLKGLHPTDQPVVDKLLSDYFARKSEEEKERMKIETETIAVTPVPQQLPSSQPQKGKKGSAKAKKSATSEKPVPPAEPPEHIYKGSMAIGATSLAVAKAGAKLKKIPLYIYIAMLKYQEMPLELTMPLPMVTLLSCGKSSPGKLNLLKELIAIPSTQMTVKQSLKMFSDLQLQITRMLDASSKTGAVSKADSDLGCIITGYDRLEQPLDIIQESCKNLGLTLGEDLHLAVNCAAHELMDYEKGKYEIITGVHKSPDELVDYIVDLTSRYPAVIAVIDPLRKEDKEQWANLQGSLGRKCYLIAEAASKTISTLLLEENLKNPMHNCILLKQVNQTTISDLIEITKHLEGQTNITALGSSDWEIADDSLGDLAVGLGAKFVKLGGLSRGERVIKYNRLVAIEEELAQKGTMGERQPHMFSAANEVIFPIEESGSLLTDH